MNADQKSKYAEAGLRPYNCAYFAGGAVSYASQGRCSRSGRHGSRSASWMRAGTRAVDREALCDQCALDRVRKHFSQLIRKDAANYETPDGRYRVGDTRVRGPRRWWVHDGISYVGWAPNLKKLREALWHLEGL